MGPDLFFHSFRTWVWRVFFCFVLAFVFFLLCLWFSIFVFSSSLPYPSFSTPAFTSLLEIEGNFLAISPISYEVLPPSLEEEVFCVVGKKRPDSSDASPCLEVVLPKSQERQKTDFGKKVYLCWNKKKGYSFAKKKSALWIEPQRLEENKLLCAIGINHEKKEKIFPGYVSLKEEGDKITEEGSFEELFSAVWKGSDVLSPYWDATSTERERIDISNRAVFVKKGDILFWNKMWQVISDPSLGRGFPMARVEDISEQNVKIIGWTPDGQKHFSILLHLNKDPYTKPPEKMFSSIRLRSKNQVSLSLGRQRLFLRKGDWLIEKQGRWKRVFKREGENKPVWSTMKASCFFYFEGIVNKGNKKLIKGYRFNSAGTASFPVEEEILVSSKKGRKESRGKL